MDQLGVEQRPVNIKPRTGIPQEGLSSEPVKSKGIVGKFKQAVRRIWVSPESETKPEPRRVPPKAF